VATATTQVKILVPGHQSMVTLLGQRDAFLKQIEVAFPADVLVRGNEITITGPPETTEQVGRVFEELLELLEQGYELTEDTVRQTISMVTGAAIGDLGDEEERPALRGPGRQPPVCARQEDRAEDLRTEALHGRDPALDRDVRDRPGRNRQDVSRRRRRGARAPGAQISRIILTRPAVEAGERLGFLPGTLYEKIDPYMRPLYDALYEMTGPDTLPRLMERGIVEVAPLAFMRGATLNDAFIILDEAQNTTPEQMKMFLTRLGLRLEGSRERRRDPGRPAGRPERAQRGRGDLDRHRGDLLRASRRQGRRPPPDRAGDRRGLRPLRDSSRCRRRLTRMRDDDKPPSDRPTVLVEQPSAAAGRRGRDPRARRSDAPRRGSHRRRALGELRR
jgi:phosphate starvation-inducible PhoH-like protein